MAIRLTLFLIALSTLAKPNIVLTVADDLGTVDLNCYGSGDLHTPHLDHLAADGLKFSQFYVVSPVCASSRGAFLTGRYPDHNGVSRNGGSLHPDETTIAEMLKPAGYHSALIGKWHVGMGNGGPNGEGFDYFFGHRGGCIENYQHNTLNWDTGEVTQHDLWKNSTRITRNDRHFGDLIADESAAYIQKHKDRPFFLYVAFNNPHYPVQPLPKHLAHYADLKEPRRSYAAFVSTMDEQVGRIIQSIDDAGIRDNTLIVFMSDHGASQEKRNALFIEDADPDNPGGGSAGRFKGGKFQLTEGGIRVPFIASWKGQLPAGETRGQVAASIDLLLTFATLAIAVPPKKPIDGKPLQPIFADSAAPTQHEALRYAHPSHSYRAIRQGKWKLIRHHDNDIFLSDMEADDTEQESIHAQHPEVVERLSTLLTAMRPEPINILTGPEKRGGWRLLFNGRDFKGWRKDKWNPASISVENGAIKCQGPPTMLYYDGPGKDMADFHFVADVMTHPGSNGGIFFHTKYQHIGWPIGHEAQINQTQHDLIKTGSVYAVKNNLDPVAKDNEWYRYEIIVRGRSIVTKVDGKTIIAYEEPADKPGTRKLSSGTFGIQAHDPGSIVYLKNIKVRAVTERGFPISC